jgi:hypothetical protein
VLQGLMFFSPNQGTTIDIIIVQDHRAGLRGFYFMHC